MPDAVTVTMQRVCAGRPWVWDVHRGDDHVAEGLDFDWDAALRAAATTLGGHDAQALGLTDAVAQQEGSNDGHA